MDKKNSAIYPENKTVLGNKNNETTHISTTDVSQNKTVHEELGGKISKHFMVTII